MQDMVYISSAATYMPKDVFWAMMGTVQYILGSEYDEKRIEVLVAGAYRSAQDSMHSCLLLHLLRYRDGYRGVDIPGYISICMPCH